jgi:hypothetical protein
MGCSERSQRTLGGCTINQRLGAGRLNPRNEREGCCGSNAFTLATQMSGGEYAMGGVRRHATLRQQRQVELTLLSPRRRL